MCVKVSGLREIGEAGVGTAALADHELPRVRESVMRTLGRIGDTEHVIVVEQGQYDAEASVRKAAGRSLEQLRRRLDLG
jgi:HEAT repeat protein